MFKQSLKRIGLAFKSVFSGIYLIHFHILWKYVSLPTLITLVAGVLLKTALAGLISIYLAKLLTQYLKDWVPFFEYIPVSLTKATLAFMISWPILWLLSFIMTFVYNLIGTIVWGFFSGPLAERIQLIMTGQIKKIPFQTGLKWSAIGILDSMKDLILFLLAFAFGFLLIKIPLVGIGLQFIFMAAVNAYLIGRSNFRNALIIRCKTVKERNRLIRKNLRPECFGLGLPEVLASYIPIVNIFVFFFLWAGAVASSIKTVVKQGEWK